MGEARGVLAMNERCVAGREIMYFTPDWMGAPVHAVHKDDFTRCEHGGSMLSNSAAPNASQSSAHNESAPEGATHETF